MFAFEPNPALIHLLKRNLEANKVVGEVIAQAVSESEGIGVLFQNSSDWASSLLEHADARRLDVPMVTIDTFAGSNNLRSDFVKIDVEGAEERVFRGAVQTLQTLHPDLLFEIWPKTTSVEALRRLLLSCGYERFWTFTRNRMISDDHMRLASGRGSINYFSSVRVQTQLLLSESRL